MNETFHVCDMSDDQFGAVGIEVSALDNKGRVGRLAEFGRSLSETHKSGRGRACRVGGGQNMTIKCVCQLIVSALVTLRKAALVG